MATAAHCVHSGSSFFTPLPDFTAGAGTAGGTWTVKNSTTTTACYIITVMNCWDGDEDFNVSCDRSVVDMRGCSFSPKNSLGMSTSESASMHFIYGYPGTVPSGPSGTLWGIGDGSLDTSSAYPDRIFYRIDMTDGQSGAGVYKLQNGRQVIGINVGFYNSWPDSYDDNQGRDIDGNVFDWFEEHGM